MFTDRKNKENIMEIDIYLDVLFALNFIMDLVIIFAVTVLSRLKISITRISVSSGFLALYGTLIFQPGIDFFYSLTGRIFVSAAAVYVLLPKKILKKYLCALGLFWLVSAAMGGMVWGICMIPDSGIMSRSVIINSGVYMDVGLDTLIVGITAVYGMIFGFKKMCIRNFSRDKILFDTEIVLDGKVYESTVLADTGCELLVPLTGEGVLIVSKKCLRGANPDIFAYIPINTAGGGARIPVFYPDKIICRDGYTIKPGAVVGIMDGEFTDDGLYDAVINPIVIEKVEKSRGVQNVEKNKKSTFFSGTKAEAVGEKGRFLHRRKRESAGALKPRGGSCLAGASVKSEIKRGGASDTDRTKPETCCVHSKKI